MINAQRMRKSYTKRQGFQFVHVGHKEYPCKAVVLFASRLVWLDPNSYIQTMIIGVVGII